METNCKGKMGIYISSPKSYSDVFDVFLKCQQKYWGNLSYPMYLSTNYEANYDNVIVFNSNNPNDSWVERSIWALSKISEKYVMLLCDDTFFASEINSDDVEKILNFMDEEQINFCRLEPLKKGKRVSTLPFLNWVRRNTPYGINLQRGIYNRQFLLALLGNGDQSAWDIESELLKEAMQSDKTLFTDVVACNKDIIPIIHGVDKGKWIPSAIQQLKRRNITINSSREQLSIKYELIQNLKRYFSRKLSSSVRSKVKKILTKIGYKFTTKY